MSIVAGPVFLLAFALVLGAMLAPVLLMRRRAFAYAVLYDGLFEVASEVDDQDAVEKGETAGEEVRVVAVELRNASGLNIERSHYDRPITVSFGEGTKILGVEVVEEEPPGLGVALRGVPDHAPEKVTLGPVLFNDGNMVLLEAVVAGSDLGEIEVEGRMVGIDGIAEQRRTSVDRTVLALANGIPTLMAVSLGSLYVGLVGFVDMDLSGPSTLNAVSGALAGLVAGDVVLLAGVYRRWRRRRAVQRRMISRRLGNADSAE